VTDSAAGPAARAAAGAAAATAALGLLAATFASTLPAAPRPRPLAEPPTVSEPLLRVTPADVTELERRFVAAMARPPTPAERDLAVARWGEEEMLVREARLRGLDRDDPVIRRHLADKMRDLLAGDAAVVPPDEAALRARYATAPERYARPARVTLRQLWVPADEGEAAAHALRGALEAGRDPADLTRGPAPGGPVLRQRTLDHLASTHGQALADWAGAAEPGTWGVVASDVGRSGAGWHVATVEQREPGGVRPFDEVRDRVRIAEQAARLDAARAEAVEALRARWTVEGWP
jgi:peptidyl-prolyl cis-trans isomerase C